MLREFKHVKQEPGPGFRRWWTGDGLELIAWFDELGGFIGFQLCYGARALTWRNNGYWTHVCIDEDNDRAWRQASPVLMSNGAPPRPPRSLVTRFKEAAEPVAPSLREAVLGVLRALA